MNQVKHNTYPLSNCKMVGFMILALKDLAIILFVKIHYKYVWDEMFPFPSKPALYLGICFCFWS